jgi:hypothetical protein
MGLTLVALLVLVFLAKIVFIDSPVGQALGDAIRNMAPPKVPPGAASRADLESMRRDMEELREQVDRVIEEQAFLTQLLAEPERLRLGPGDTEDRDT